MADAALFTDLDDPIYEEALFFIEPKDRDPASEDDRQAAFVKLVRRSSGVRMAAVLNDHNWGMKGLNRARKLGAWWGFPDTIVTAAPGLTAMLEFKNGVKMPEPHQIDCLNALHRMGFPVGVFRTARCAFDFLREHGFPIAEPRAPTPLEITPTVRG